MTDKPSEWAAKRAWEAFPNSTDREIPRVALALDAAVKEWRDAALSFGEGIVPSGPTDYYTLTPRDWWMWATVALALERDRRVKEAQERQREAIAKHYEKHGLTGGLIRDVPLAGMGEKP